MIKHFSTCLKINRNYFLCLLASIIVLFACILFFGNEVFYISLKNDHPVWLNIFFINYTFTGDRLFVISLSAFLVIYLKKIQLGTQLFVAFLICTFLIQWIKNMVSPGGFELFIEQGQYLFSTDTAPTADQFSFPSGHTAIAFSMATIFASYTKKIFTQIFILFTALLLAFSRIYLAQHQLVEVIAGMIIGTLSGVFALVAPQSVFSGQHFFKGRNRIRVVPQGKRPDFLAT